MKQLLVVLVVILSLGVGLATINQENEAGEVAGTSSQVRIEGLVVPHFTGAEKALGTAVEAVRKTGNYEAVLLLSPNHFVPEAGLAITGNMLEGASSELVDMLVNASTDLHLDNNLVSQEHGLIVPMKQLNKVFSQTPIVPVMIANHYSEKKLANLARVIEAVMPRETLYVVSVDFAHELMQEEALENTRYATTLISNFDHEAILALDDKYMDAPEAMSLFLRLVQLRGADKFEMWETGHSGLLYDNPTIQGTSYMTGVFEEE